MIFSVVRGENDGTAPFSLAVIPQDSEHILVRSEGSSSKIALGDTLSIGGGSVVFLPTATYPQYIGKEIVYSDYKV